MKTFLKIPYYLLIVGVAGVGLLLFATLMPIPGNFKVKIVKSGSMEPAIKTGGIVFIKPVSSYKVGDVITFGLDTKTQIPTTHRIVGEEGEGASKVFTTQGDANDSIDPKTTKFSEVRGKVIFSISYLGYVLDFARKPLGFVLLVGVPAAVIIFDETGKIWREIKKMRGKKVIVKEEIRKRNVLDLRVKEIVVEKKKDLTSNFSLKTISFFLIMAGSLIGLGRIGNTVSFYKESEFSIGNILGASDTFDNLALRVAEVLGTTTEVVSEEKVGEKSEEKLDLAETEILEETLATDEVDALTTEDLAPEVEIEEETELEPEPETESQVEPEIPTEVAPTIVEVTSEIVPEATTETPDEEVVVETPVETIVEE